MAKIKEIARFSGYSIGTVSRVINNNPHVSDNARNEIQAIIKELGFEHNSVSRTLKQKTNKQILVIVKGRENNYLSNLCEQIERELRDSDKEMSVTYVSENDDEVAHAVKLYNTQRPEGIIFLGIDPKNFDEKFSVIDIPCVILTNMAKGLHFTNLSSFSTNDTEAGKMVGEYLISKGHHNIGIVGGSRVDDDTCIDCLRYNGFVEALKGHGIPFDRNRQYVSSDFSYDGGYYATIELLKKNPDVSAIFAIADIVAIGAMRALEDSGKKVPDDVSIVGFDGIKQCDYTIPRLTTVCQNSKEFAHQGVTHLLNTIADPELVSVNGIVPFSLKEQESVKKI